MSELYQVKKDQLLDDVRDVIESAEQLADIAKEDLSDETKVFRDRVSARLQVAKARLAEAEEAAFCHAKAAAKVADEFVNENPYKSIGVAAAVGFLLGLLVSRR